MVAPEARPAQQAKASGTEGEAAGYGGPVGASLLGGLMAVRIRSGSVNADISGSLEATLQRVVETAYGELRNQLEGIGSAIVSSAESTWYTQVARRTGETGKIEQELQLSSDKLTMVVQPQATNKTYVVRRPAANSTLRKRATREEYSAAMSQYRSTGQLPAEWSQGDVQIVRGRPVNLNKRTPNPKASDGKLLWQELVIKPGKALATRLKREGSAAIRDALNRNGR